VLACLTVAAIHPALAADPQEAPAASSKEAPVAVQAPVGAPTASSPPAPATPVNPTSATAASATATATAASNTPAATAPDADSDAAQLEKRMRTKGFTTRIERGGKMFCRREGMIGTRLGGTLRCMNAAEARNYEQRVEQDQEQLRQRMMQSCLMNRMPNGQATGANCGN